MEGRFWCDDKGEPIRNWGMLLTVWVRNRARFAALRAVPSEKVPWANGKVAWTNEKVFGRSGGELRTAVSSKPPYPGRATRPA